MSDNKIGWHSKQFFLDSTWRAFRTFCQSLAGYLVVIQTTNLVVSTPISVPWWAYIYASGISGFISLLQSIDRERAVSYTLATESASAALPAPSNGFTVVTPMHEPDSVR